jgi:phosphate starvation-inducible protein PhoH
MSFQIKISGIDKNINKHIWIDIDTVGLDLNEECEYIRRNPNKKEKIEEPKKFIKELENRVKKLSIYKPPAKKIKIEETMEVEETVEEKKIDEEIEEIEEIENKIDVLSLDEKPKYILNKDQEKILEYIEKYIDSNEIITVSGIAGAGKTFTILHIFDKLHELT